MDTATVIMATVALVLLIVAYLRGDSLHIAGLLAQLVLARLT